MENISRRNFMLGAAALGTTVAATMAGCAPKATSTQALGNTGEGAATASSWDAKPEPLDAASAIESVDCDILVVGAGICGIPAALTAVEDGARTVLIESTDEIAGGPHWIGCVDSKLMREAGVTYDRAAIVNDLMWHASYRADQSLIQLWFDKSGETADWYTERIERDGEMSMMIETAQKETGGAHMSPPIAHVPVLGQYTTMGPNETGLKYSGEIMLKQAIEQGLDYRTLMTGRELIQDESGAVTGMLATDADGNIVRFNTAKGVILCTGGYLADEEMCRALNPAQFESSKRSSGNPGDGIKMGLWAGGEMNDMHWWMDNDRGIPSGGIWRPGSQPWLRTDVYGTRYSNEDAPYDYGAYAGSLNPDHLWWDIFDDNYWHDVEMYGTTICSRMFPVEGAINSEQVQHSKEEFYEVYIAPFLEKGSMVTADTIDGLAVEMAKLDDRIDPSTLQATIDRYNELCSKGIDEDFGKLGFRMQPVNQGPFFAMLQTGVSICNLDGLRINTNIEVIDKQGNPVPGLYAAGNDCGGFYGMSYPWYYGGLNCGMAITFSRLAVKHAMTC